jgi:predicted nucleotidyltransferase
MKRILQKLAVKTSFPPFIWFYRLCYAACLWAAVAILKRQRSLTAAYLISSMATRDVVYGLSDIDLILIVDDDDHKEEVARVHRKITRWIPLIKYDEMGLYSTEEIRRRRLQRGEIYLKYKLFTECKKRGRLLFGVDILADLEELQGEGREEYILGQLAFTWSIFLKSFLVGKKPPEGLMSNYLCYKITSDMCKAYISARWKKESFNRREALTLAQDSVAPTHRLHLERMRHLPRTGFAGKIPALLNDTYDFCMHMLRLTREHLTSLRTPDADADLPLAVEAADLIFAEATTRRLDGLVALVATRYAQCVRSVVVSNRDILYNSLLNEEQPCLLVVTEGQLPFEAVLALSEALGAERSSQHLHLYLLTSDLAIALNRYDREQVQASLFPVPWIDRATLRHLTTPAAVVFGTPLKLGGLGNGELLDLVLPSKCVITRFIASNDLVRLSALKFQVFFWEALHLQLLLRAAGAGEAVALLSSRQLCRQLTDLPGFALPWLEEFHGEYRRDLNNLPSRTESYVPRAVTALRRLYAEGA